MASATSILKLKVEDNEYEASLKRARQGMRDLQDSLKNAGKSFADLDREQVKYIRAIGQMETSNKSARGNVSELTSAFIDMSQTYKHMSDEMKQSDAGRALAQSLDQLKQRTIEAKKELESLSAEIGDVSQTAQGMGSQLSGALGGLVGNGGTLGGVARSLGASQTALLGIGAAVTAAGTAFKLVGDNIQTALSFERSMSHLSALTGKTGKELDKLKEYAIELGSTTTLTASQVADAFRLIGSQQPQLLASSEALKEVTKYAIRLSEAAGIDLATASQTLSTSINQMGGDSENAARYVNVLAAASQKGAGDIAWLGEAITKSATSAKAVGTDYEELVSNLEQLAKAGFDASTAGTALRSIIMNLEKQANDQFKPSIVGLTKAFENLKEANLDISGYQAIAGKMFATQAMALANASMEARNMTAAITGTNIAEEQASTNTANLDGSLKALSSAWEGLNLHINSSNGALKVGVDRVTDLVRAADSLITSVNSSTGALSKMGDALTAIADVSLTPIINKLIMIQGVVSWLSGKKAEAATGIDINDVNKQIEALKGSEYKRTTRDDQLKRYDDRIAQIQRQIDNQGSWGGMVKSTTVPSFIGDNGTSALQKQLDELKRNRALFEAQANDIINGKEAGVSNGATDLDLSVNVDSDEAENALERLRKKLSELQEKRKIAISAGDNEQSKKLAQEISRVKSDIKALDPNALKTPSGIDPVKQAQQKVATAMHEHEQAIEAAKMSLQNGTKTKADYNRQLLSAEERLWNALGDAYHIHQDPKYKEAQDKCAERIQQLGEELVASIEAQKKAQEAARELANAQKRAADAQRKMDEARANNDYKAWSSANKQYQAAQEDMQWLSAPQMPNVESVTVPMSLTYTEGNLASFISTLKEKIQGSELGTELYSNLTAQIADANALGNLMKVAVQNGIDIAQFNPQALWGKVFGDNPGDYIQDSELQSIVTRINEYFEANGIEPIKIDFKTGSVNSAKQLNKEGDSIAHSFQQAASAVGSLGSALQGIEDPGARVAGIIANAIATVAQTFAKSLAGTFTPWDWIAGAAAGTATMFSTIAAIKKATAGSYEGGGIVPGNSFSGDRLTANVNSGELILNRSQQNSLAGQLMGVEASRSVGKSDVTISSENIRIILHNAARSRGMSVGEYLEL